MESGDHEFEAILGYIVKLHFKGKKIILPGFLGFLINAFYIHELTNVIFKACSHLVILDKLLNSVSLHLLGKMVLSHVL